MKDKSGHILGLGLVVVDHIMTVERYPNVDSKNEAVASLTQIGGPVPIALSQLVKFGHRCRFIGSWGSDPWGQLVENSLSQRGIEFEHSIDTSQATSVSQVWLEQPSGRRTSCTVRNCRTGIETRLRKEDLSQCQLLHLDGWPGEIAIETARVVKSHGGLVAIDTGSPKPGVDEILKLADIVNAPRKFAEQFMGESDIQRASRAIAEYGPKVVCVTDGENGAAMFADGETRFEPATRPPQVVDTNGAGDCFSGALIHGVLQQWSPERILRFCTVSAGIKCTRLGNDEALPTLEQVEQTISDRS
ncbi:PfkB family carbohydrate kinase [Thalassoglobus sp. JC818]|uniref:carbohydrate kinase family protein n=1 Tax=Thalassoglobus sp. JC818 TaxID=3232136 RepID=UPI003459472C